MNLGRVIGSYFYSGSTVPLGAQYNDLDVYLHTTTGNLYKKVTGSWVLVMSIIGPTGPGGATWLTGAGAPGAIGTNGDLYLNATNGDVYQKAAGVWGVIMNVMGPTGPTGAAGSTWRYGTTAPVGALGSNGDYYLRTSSGLVYYKSGGVWSPIFTLGGSTVTISNELTPGPNGSNDVFIQNLTGRVWLPSGASWRQDLPIGNLIRYGLPNLNNDITGPGFMAEWNMGGGTQTDVTLPIGVCIEFSVIAQELGVRCLAPQMTSGVTDMQFSINWGASSGTTIFWMGLLEVWPDGTASTGGGHFGFRYNAVLGDTHFVLSAADETGAHIATDVSTVKPANQDYHFHLQFDRDNSILKGWIFDQDMTLMDQLTVNLAANWAAETTKMNLTFNLSDAVGAATVNLYKMGVSK